MLATQAMRARYFNPDIIMVRRGVGRGRYTLIPVDERAADAIGRMPEGEAIGIRIMRKRSLPQHNLFWAVLDHVAKATKFENAERLLVALKIRLGRYDLMEMPNGRVVPIPQSISFGEMTQDEFQKFFDESIALICSEVLPGTDSEALIGKFDVMLSPSNDDRRDVRVTLEAPL